MADRLLAVWITVLACAMPTRVGVAPAAAQRDEAARPRGALTADGARAMLERMAPGDGWWVTRNDAYTSADPAEPDYYAMRFERGPTGLTVSGCMWGGKDDRLVGPFWHFFAAWDPSERAVLLYQVAPGGAVAVGHAVERDGVREGVQWLHVPGQPAVRIRHLSERPHPDTLQNRGFAEEGGEWRPRRRYTWVWTPADGADPPVC